MDLQLLAMIAKLFSKRKEPAAIVTAGVDVQSDRVAARVGSFPGMDSMHACVADIESSRAKLRAATQCDRPPVGWGCTRPKGHAGPCAAAMIWHPELTRDPNVLSAAEWDVLAERKRQVDDEHYTAAHDDEEDAGTLASAASAYALSAADALNPFSQGDGCYKEDPPVMWPDGWGLTWWKPTTPRRDLVKAAALIISEIEKIDRADAREAHGDTP